MCNSTAGRVFGISSIVISFPGLFLACFIWWLLSGISPVWSQAPDARAETLSKSFVFRKPALGAKLLAHALFTTVRMPGMLSMARNPGEPALPVFFVRILLPPGGDVENIRVAGTLCALDTNDIDLKKSPVSPYQAQVPIGSPPAEEPAFDRAVYQSAEMFPTTHHDAPVIGYCRGYTILSVGLYPVKYAPATGRLFYFSEMTLEIELKDSGRDNPFFRDRKEDADWVSRLVCNPELRHRYRTASRISEKYPGGLCDTSESFDYVIITTKHANLDYWPTGGTLPHNWQSLMDRHAAEDGLRCTLVTIEDILAEQAYRNPDPLFDDAPARTREFCKDAYLDWGIEYLLIGSDVDWIPSREMDSKGEWNIEADIYWSNLDNTFNDDHDDFWGEEGDTGFDLYAELFMGRVTCDVPKDVSNWLTKCFYYADSEDQEYLQGAGFYGGNTMFLIEGDDVIDFSAIKGTRGWLGYNPSAYPYPCWAGFQYGFETWNKENPGAGYDLSIRYTDEPLNPGWKGGPGSWAGIPFRKAVTRNQCTHICGVAHGNPWLCLDFHADKWMNKVHNTKPFFMHDQGCHCGNMGDADDGVLHAMLFHSDTSLAFACVYNTGYGWCGAYSTASSSALHMKSFWDYLFDIKNHSLHSSNWQMGKAMNHARSMLAPAINWHYCFRSTIQNCHLFGDPAQRLKPPAVSALFISLPEGLPRGIHPPGIETEILIRIQDGRERLVTGSGHIHYRFDTADPFTAVPLAFMGDDLFLAVIPHTAPGDEPEFYFSAKGNGGTTVCSPWNAPDAAYEYDVGFVEKLFHDDFEQDMGWCIQNINLADGAWERGIPAGNGGMGDPPWDADGSGTCYLTGNREGESDVDGGPTQLESPSIDLSAGDAQVCYSIWYYNYLNNDPFRVEVSNDDCKTWHLVEEIEPCTAWSFHCFNVADFVKPTNQVRVRFTVKDDPDDSFTEAGLDAFQVRRILEDATLWADGYGIKTSTGSVIDFSLDAGPAHGKKPYLLLGSASGTFPGIPLPGGAVLPLNWDVLFSTILGSPGSLVFQQFMGNLDGLGTAKSTLNALDRLDPALIGMKLHFAFLLEPDPFFASNAVSVILEP